VKKKLIAQRYARAFVANLTPDINADITKDLELLQQVFAADVVALLSSKLLPQEQKVEFLDLISAETKQADLWKGFFHLLQSKQRIVVIQDVIKAIDELILSAHNKQRVTIYLAHEQTPQLVDSIKAKVAAILGKEIIAAVEIDPSIIGGFEVKAGSKEINASIKSGLARFAASR
jgi:F-type H+-transporting ATPase subunit delta